MSFTYDGHAYDVVLRSGATKWRDSRHLGGPWTDVQDTVKNPAVKLGFRRALVKAERELLQAVQSAACERIF